MGGAGEGLYGRPWPVSWQFQQGGSAVQLLFPVVKLLLQDLPLQALALPERVVGVLDGQGG